MLVMHGRLVEGKNLHKRQERKTGKSAWPCRPPSSFQELMSIGRITSAALPFTLDLVRAYGHELCFKLMRHSGHALIVQFFTLL